MNILKRAYIWLKRIRHRKGYGIHSPFAFNLITDVIYERRPYYAYSWLKELRREAPRKGKRYTERVDKLLFRLVNYVQPTYILEIGTGLGLSLRYLAAGQIEAQCISLCGNKAEEFAMRLADDCKNGTLICGEVMNALQKELRVHPEIEFLHIAHTNAYEEVFEKALEHVGRKSLFVIEGIHDNKNKFSWWERIVEDKRTGITFDLYELGLIFFDLDKNKQHYIVNF